MKIDDRGSETILIDTNISLEVGSEATVFITHFITVITTSDFIEFILCTTVVVLNFSITASIVTSDSTAHLECLHFGIVIMDISSLILQLKVDNLISASLFSFSIVKSGVIIKFREPQRSDDRAQRLYVRANGLSYNVL